MFPICVCVQDGRTRSQKICDAPHPENEDVDLAIRSDGAGKKVVVEEVLRAVAEDDAGSDHHAAQRVPDHPYLVCQLSGGET
jgi:hypothetical protein